MVISAIANRQPLLQFSDTKPILQGHPLRNQTADVTWNDQGIPVSTQFDDPYYSLQDGLAETRHVFLRGNGLPGRFSEAIHIGELGFGTGLNFLTTWAAWQAHGAGKPLWFTSFEAFPMTGDQMGQALAAFPELAALAQQLCSAWTPAGGTFALAPQVTLEVMIGDAATQLPAWGGHADAWYLDGFSPAKNPALWTDALMQAVGHHTAPGGSFATYTAAGFVRRALQEAGFTVTREAGFGRKRHMTSGWIAP
jgi:tRNA U34 5-methylaminomethyl-2-thiouridine-forming methyltransferase MnmC